MHKRRRWLVRHQTGRHSRAYREDRDGHGDLSVKADGRCGNQRRARGNGGAVDCLACGIIVGTIKDDVGGVCQFDKPGLIEKFGNGCNVCLAVDLFQTALHRKALFFTDVGFGKRDLALKIGLVDGIGIGNCQAADTGGGKIRQGRRTQPAATDNEHMGGQEFSWPSIPISSSKIWRLNRKSC